MEYLTPLSSAGLASAMALLLTLLIFRRHKNSSGARRRGHRDALDTVADWQPQIARVLTVDERQAHDLLRRALPPDFLVMAQVPLSRFLRVPMRQSYAEWLHRVGHLSADLLVCDACSNVLLAVDVRAAAESERSRQRHDRLGRVLRAAGVRVQVWQAGALPSVGEVRAIVAALLQAQEPVVPASSVSPIPVADVADVADVAEMLAEGDRIDHSMEPVASGFYDEMELVPASAPAKAR